MVTSERIKHIGISPTMKIAAKAIQMRAAGTDVVDFSVGEPDFPTPDYIKDAGKHAIDHNYTKYTVNAGTMELRQAIARKLNEDNQLHYQTDEIIVTNGAKHSLYNVVMALVNPGDEVIIPAPYWVSYPEMVRLAQGKPVIVNTKEENGFKLQPDELQQSISANTRALILCSPSNPTGAAYNLEQLQALAEVIKEEDLWVISDEIYEKLVYDDFRFVSFAALGNEIKAKTVIINGLSKAFAMTGWRLGYAAGPADVIDAANKIQSHSTSNASAIAQYAALKALSGPGFEINRMVAQFQKRRNYMIHQLQKIPGVSCRQPEGAFYAFPNIASYFDKEYNGTYIRNSYGLAYYLLKEAHVVLVPGAAFGADRFVRISYATSMDQIEKGMARITEALQKLKTPAKLKYASLNNTVTRVKQPVPVSSDVDMEQGEALVAEAEAHLRFDQYFEWNANINGMIVQLRTNNAHLYDFWMENWYPAQLEAELEPHGIVYAVEGVTGREPHAFYNSESKTAVLFNCDYYGSLRSLALGLVTDVGERLFNLHAIRGMSGDYQGMGFMLLGPKGTYKTEIFYRLMQKERFALHGIDMAFTRYGGGYAVADNPERKFYMPTHTAEIMESLATLFDRSKCENVVTTKEGCDNHHCPQAEECLIDRGFPYCYNASKRSAAMLDPYWLGGMEKHVKRIDVRRLFLLNSEPLAEPISELPPEEALKLLQGGTQRGAASRQKGKSYPFYNPHLLLHYDEHMQRQKQLFAKLLQQSQTYLVNVEALSLEETIEKIKSKIKG